MQPITKYDQDVARIMKDPVLWTEAHLGQKPRWYQEQILRHPHHRIVLRCGRRLGKCIAGTQRVLNAETGAYETLEDLFKKQSIPMFTLDDAYKIKKDTSFRIEENGVKPTFRITAKHGSQVELTGNHPVLTLEGWKEVDLLKVGDAIAVPKKLAAFGTNTPETKRVKVVGYLTGALKRTLNGDTLQLSTEESRQEIVNTVRESGLSIFPKSTQTHFILDKEKEYEQVILDAGSESITKEVFTYDKTSLAIFLSALYDARGWHYAKRVAEIGFGTRSSKFARDLKHLLLRFGIDANIIKRMVHGEDYWQVMIYAKSDVLSFIEQIGVYSIKNYVTTREKAEQMTERQASIPKEIWNHVEKKRLERGMKKHEVTGDRSEKFRKNVGLAEEKALRYSENLQDAWLYDLANSDVYWEEITSIESAGEQMTYDVFMPKHHNLIVEDILVHNTWTMVAHMLWAAFTNLGGTKKNGPVTCLVATPYDSQARLIFDELRQHIDGNELLSDSIKTITKNPYYIEFKSGAKIKLFTAGTSAGQSAASMRGQKADYLYLDKRVIEFVPTYCEVG